MRSLFTVFLLFCITALYAQKSPVATLSFSTGYQSSNLRWSIAGNLNGKSPNILSEVKWNALRGPILSADLKINLTKRWFISGGFAKAYIKSGNATDTDYSEDNREAQTYHAALRSDEGNLSNFGIAAGYKILLREKLEIAVMAGYTDKKENLLLLDHVVALEGENALHSSYGTNWTGISTAVSVGYVILPKLKLNATLSYDQLKYKGQADWNLIDAFQHPLSFEQNANGYELGVLLGFVYQLKSYLLFNVSGTYAHAETGNGTDKLFLDDGSTQSTQFNAAVKNVKNISLGLTVRF